MIVSWQVAVSAATLGILGSAHCVGMCGPLVAALSIHGGASGWRRDLPYVGGRALTYSIVGGLCGAFGATLDAALPAGPSWAMLIGGILMVLAGLRSLLGARARPGPLTRLWQERIEPPLRRVLQRGDAGVAFVLGAGSAFLPCGLLLAAYGQAAATAHPLPGAAVMLIFALSSAPALVAVARLARWLARQKRQRLNLVAGAAVLLLGLLTLGQALLPLLQDEPAPSCCEAMQHPATDE